MRPLIPEAEFIELYRLHGPKYLERKLNSDPGTIGQRRRAIERRLGIEIKGPREKGGNGHPRIPSPQVGHRAQINIKDGTILVPSDSHYWPGPPSLMHRALVFFCKEMKPKAVVHGGDVIDAPTISRHMPIGWENRPKLIDEIEAAKERLSEIEKATFKARKVWVVGNHDARFETRLAHVAPEYAKIHGVHLKDHFEAWEPAWSCWVNDDIVIKHRFKNGIHAPHNNTIWAGKSVITGHLHSAKVVPFTDYNGTRYGVDAGCIAETDHKAFVDYTEDNPKNWRSAFCVLTFKDGILMQPELVLKFDDKRVQFRGQVFTP